MSSLLESRWAPRSGGAEPPSSGSSSTRLGLLSPSEELSRLRKIVARLKWKLPFLAEGYRLATQREAPAEVVAHAEIMFKLDFHEYYALLERALVHLLGVFGIAVSAAPKNAHGMGLHRYHANVIEALEARSSPLRGVFKTGDRLRQLRRAKELRNRWKTADLSQEDINRDEFGFARNDRVSGLESYDLEKILADIFDALEDGYQLAETHAAQTDVSRSSESRLAESEIDWDFIVDAMDWEAV